jgi:hypothetical protein
MALALLIGGEVNAHIEGVRRVRQTPMPSEES